MGTIGTALVGLLMLAEQSGSAVGSENDIGPKYHRYDYRSRCGDVVFQVLFHNGHTARSRVDQVLIDGVPVPGAAKTLDRFAARGAIDSIEIMHCDRGPSRSPFRGVTEFSEGESRTLGMRWTLAFRLIQEGEDWRISID